MMFTLSHKAFLNKDKKLISIVVLFSMLDLIVKKSILSAMLQRPTGNHIKAPKKV